MDTPSSRRRQGSNANASKATNPASSQQPNQVPQSKSAHTADPFLQPFLDPSFDAAEYLNTSLPPLRAPGVQPRPGRQAVPLADLSSEAQTLLTQLDAHSTRLCNTLTQLTDDILRSGSRLAYQVELLRGETLGLVETLNDTLRDDIEKFIPGGFEDADPAREKAPHTQTQDGSRQPSQNDDATHDSTNEPPYIRQLRTLTLVRARLDSVIKTFGAAMDFVFPPSEVSVSSSFLSVSAPEPGKEQQSSEEKGQQVLKSLRDEISKLLNDQEDPVRGIERAAQRIEQLKELATVWKGTAEEKGRTKFIDSLAKMVEDRHRDLLRESEQDSKKDGTAAVARADGAESKVSSAGYGLMSQLQKIRSGL